MAGDMDRLEKEIGDLKLLLARKEKELAHLKSEKLQNQISSNEDLTCDDVVRFCRQMILPQIGREGQLKLKQSRVLVIGAGGLGCPVLLYLITAGVGHLTVVDSDLVETSNLHRQTLHSDQTVGIPKVDSTLQFLQRYQGYTKVETLYERFTPQNAHELVTKHDIVIDATDNIGTRYLINDECVRSGKPLVSGSALGMEGQVTVYHASVQRNGETTRGPCYRCLFPTPPPAGSSANCSQAGVLGPVPGLIGLIQSIETIKLIVDWPGCSTLAGRMILFDANDMSLRTVKLRLASPDCPACGKQPLAELPYYSGLSGMTVCAMPLQLLTPESRLSPEAVRREQEQLLLLDVRSRGEFGMCHIEGSHNFPLTALENSTPALEQLLATRSQQCPQLKVCCICRRGNDSQRAVVRLRELLPQAVPLLDMVGGLHNWARTVDTNFPVY